MTNRMVGLYVTIDLFKTRVNLLDYSKKFIYINKTVFL